MKVMGTPPSAPVAMYGRSDPSKGEPMSSSADSGMLKAVNATTGTRPIRELICARVTAVSASIFTHLPRVQKS